MASQKSEKFRKKTQKTGFEAAGRGSEGVLGRWFKERVGWGEQKLCQNFC